VDTPERRRVALVVAGIVGLLALAIGDVGILLWAAALGAVAVAATLWARTAWDGLEIDAAFEPRRAFVGEDVEVRLTIANRKRLTLPIVRVIVRFPPGLTPNDDPDPTALRGHRLRLSLGATSEATFRLPVVVGTRGEYWLDDLEIEVVDPFDLVPVRRRLAVERPLLVMPEPRSGVPLRIVRRLPFGSPAAAARLFEDREHFAGVREYEPGDPMRQVHWRLSAHSGRLQTKRFEPTRSAEVLFAVDVANGEPFWHGVDPETAEETIGWASYLARQAIHAGWRTGLIANTHFRRGHGRLRVPPATKVGAEAALFEALARMPNQPTSDLGPVLREHGRQLVQRTTVIVISPSPGDSLLQAMNILRRRGSDVILVGPAGGSAAVAS
jgi:uncharacterized protein (DUF58 family)